MKKRMVMVLMAAMTVSMLSGCGSKGTGAPAAGEARTEAADAGDKKGDDTKTEAPEAVEKVSIKFGNTQGEEDIQTKSLHEVADRLSKASGGGFTAEVYGSSALGDTDDLTEQAMQGAAILTISDPSRLASFVKDYGMLQMPYLLDDYTQLDKIMETDLYAKWEQEFSDQGIWLVTSNWFSGTRNFCLNKEVKKPEDLSGQRIRTIRNELCTSSVDAMGAVATPMSWSEVYTSIQQKALDGAEVQTPSFYATRLWEVCSYINKTEHFQLIGSAVTGTKFRDSLSDEYRELFTDTFKEVGTEYQTKCADLSEQYEKEMVEKYGVTINDDVDVEAFKAATAPVYDKLGYKEVREQLMAEMK